MVYVFTLITDYEARGRSRQQAQDNANMVNYNVVRQDSTLMFDSNISFKENASFRMQEVSMVLYVPHGQVFYMDKDLEYILRNTIHRYGYSVYDIDDNQWLFDQDGLECVTCEEGQSRRRRSNDDRERERSESSFDQDSYKEERLTFDFEDFDEVDASSKFDIIVTKGSDYDVRLFGRDKELDRVKLKQHGDVLELDTRDWKLFNTRRWKPIKVELVMPELRKIKLSGACSFEAAGFSGNDLEIDLSGASEADLDTDFNHISIELTGTSDVVISGTADELDAVLSGTSSLNALGLEVRRGDIQTRGVSSARVFVTRDLVVEANGASDVKYKGNPQLDVDEGRASSVGPY